MKKVLVVDDTKNIRTLLTKCLQMEGYDVKTAVDGHEAKEILLKESFDLAFIDIKMPYLSGTEVIKHIREMGIATPVIVITAYATVKNAIECTQMGAVAYLQKPFTADKVKAILKEFFMEEEEKRQDTELSLKYIRNLIDMGSFSQALHLLKGIISKAIDNPEIYLLLSKAYGGMNNNEMKIKFYQTYRLFSEDL